MPLLKYNINSLNRGEIGPYMGQRADNAVYIRSAEILENWIILPQGGVLKRPGTRMVYETGTTEQDELRLGSFDFRATQEYTLLFEDSLITILRDFTPAATVVSPWLGSELSGLRWAQQGDTQVIVHPEYAPRGLERTGSHSSWTLGVIDFINKPYHRYNTTQTLTPSATSGAVTLTLSGTDAGWKAGHVGVKIKANSGVASITGFPQNATGGSAASSAGTAANAFDSNPANNCNSGANGWIGYDYGSDKETRIVGINSNATATLDLVFETDDNSGYSSATVVHSEPGLALTAGTTTWIDIPAHTDERYFRVRATSGTLDVKDLTFNFGLVANATTSTNFSGTAADTGWKEEAWSVARGFPRSVTFHQGRLVFGGTRDAPNRVFLSKSGDVFNFDDSAVNDDNAFGRTIGSDQVHVIKDIKSKKNLNVFTSDGEFEIAGDNNGSLTPDSGESRQQSALGCADLPVLQIDGELMFVIANRREIRSYVYKLTEEQYTTQNKTIFAHHMFDAGRFPIAIATLNGFRDTQAKFLFVPREDGQMAVLITDTAMEVQAWGRFKTQGQYLDAISVQVDDGSGYFIDTLFVLVKRENGIYLEALTERDIFLDHWYEGEDETAKATWGGSTTLADMEVDVVGDSFDQGTFTVDGSGSVTINNDVNQIYIGLGYESYWKTLSLVPAIDNNIKRGENITKKRAILYLYKSLHVNVDGRQVHLRKFGDDLLDDPLVPFTGQIEKRIQGISRNPQVVISSDRPLPCNIMSLTVELKVA